MPKTKYLRVTMPDGSKWDVPAEVIAKNLAEEYAERPEDIEKEKAAALLGNGLLMDWAANNMDWDDVKSVAVQVVPSKETDFQEGWVNGDVEVIEK